MKAVEWLGMVVFFATWGAQIAWFAGSFYWMVWGQQHWFLWLCVWLFFVEPLGAALVAFLSAMVMTPIFAADDG